MSIRDFFRSKSPDKRTPEASSVAEPQKVPQKKGRPTPTRKEAEAALRKPLVSNDRKQAKEIDRQKRNEAYERERIALRTGDERYLPARDKGKVRRFCRDYIDARWSLSEFVLPTMLLFLVGTLVISWIRPDWGQGSNVMLGLTIGLYAFFFASLVEGILVWYSIKRQVAVRYPGQDVPRGSWFYCWARMIMARRWRSPKPQVARGQHPGASDQTDK